MIDTVILDVQHMGQPHKPFARGAQTDGKYEADLALRYAICTRERFLLAGYKTFLVCHGAYEERHFWANVSCNTRTSLYVACHLNAGGGKYPLVEYYCDAGERTRRIAKFIAFKFSDKLVSPNEASCFSQAQVWQIAHKARGWVCLSGTKMSAVLVEPLFVDNPAHMKIAEKPFVIASAIFEAVEEFNKI